MVHQVIDFFTAPFKVSKVKWNVLTIEYICSIMAHLLELVVPFAVSMIIKYATENQSDEAFLWCGILGLNYLLISLFWCGNYRAYTQNGLYFCENLYRKFLKKLAIVDEHFTDKVSHGRLYNVVNSDTVDVPLYIDAVFEVINSFVKIVVLMFIMVRVNFWIGLLLSFSGLIYYIYINYNDIQFIRYFRKQKKINDAISDVFLETLNGLHEVKTLDIEKRLRGHYEKQRKRYTREYRMKRKYYTRTENLSLFITHTTRVLTYICMAILILSEQLGVDILVLFTGYYTSLIADIDGMTDNVRYARQYRISIDRIRTILEYVDQKKVPQGTLVNTNVYGDLSFHKVSFGYQEHTLFYRASFHMKPNTINSIIGLSGSGKTSLIRLLMRQQKIDEGEILLDGSNIYNYSEDAYLSNITVITQTPFIFHMSIRENLNMVTTNREKQEAACKRAGIHDFIMSLPKGYNTIITEKAGNFSGGQKQMLSIARALLTESEILLFDDITSSLDPANVENIARLLDDLKRDHTILIVTNKVAVMERSEQILMIKNRKVHTYCTYQEMLAKNPEFKVVDIEQEGEIV